MYCNRKCEKRSKNHHHLSPNPARVAVAATYPAAAARPVAPNLTLRNRAVPFGLSVSLVMSTPPPLFIAPQSRANTKQRRICSRHFQRNRFTYMYSSVSPSPTSTKCSVSSGIVRHHPGRYLVPHAAQHQRPAPADDEIRLLPVRVRVGRRRLRALYHDVPRRDVAHRPFGDYLVVSVPAALLVKFALVNFRTSSSPITSPFLHPAVVFSKKTGT